MAIITEQRDGLTHTYSDEGRIIERDGWVGLDAWDVPWHEYTYTETDEILEPDDIWTQRADAADRIDALQELSGA